MCMRVHVDPMMCIVLSAVCVIMDEQDSSETRLDSCNQLTGHSVHTHGIPSIGQITAVQPNHRPMVSHQRISAIGSSLLAQKVQFEFVIESLLLFHSIFLLLSPVI